MDKEHLIKRLSIVKFLYKLGLEQSTKSEAISFFSILAFHDSIDMFLHVAAEKIGIERKKNERIYFVDYWTKIPTLTLRESMIKLNDRRNNLKHKGLIPGKIEIEASRVNATEFFEQNTPIIFGFNFTDISLFELVKFGKTRHYLQNAQNNLDNTRIDLCIEEVTKAFYELLFEYKETKRGFGSDYRTHFNPGEEIRFDKIRGYSSTDEKVHELDRKVENVVDKINRNFEAFNAAFEVISLGIDYKKYAKFKILTPSVYRHYTGEYRLEIYGQKNWSLENCQFLIDFVLESSLKLQEFDFNYDTLDLTKPTIVFHDQS